MKRTKAIRLIVLLLLLVLPSSQFGYAQEAPSKDFDEYVNKALKDWDVPGLAIAIVKNDQIVFAKGYGVRKLGVATPVDEKTLFAIGSSSKAFTSASIAMLPMKASSNWMTRRQSTFPAFSSSILTSHAS
jgi:CubicO group peptidase (beta-lactamase class C family)